MDIAITLAFGNKVVRFNVDKFFRCHRQRLVVYEIQNQFTTQVPKNSEKVTKYEYFQNYFHTIKKEGKIHDIVVLSKILILVFSYLKNRNAYYMNFFSVIYDGFIA